MLQNKKRQRCQAADLPALEKLHEAKSSSAWPDARGNDSCWLAQDVAMNDAGTVAAGSHVHSVLDIGCIVNTLTCRYTRCCPDPGPCHFKLVCTLVTAHTDPCQQMDVIRSKQLLLSPTGIPVPVNSPRSATMMSVLEVLPSLLTHIAWLDCVSGAASAVVERAGPGAGAVS